MNLFCSAGILGKVSAGVVAGMVSALVPGGRGGGGLYAPKYKGNFRVSSGSNTTYVTLL